MLSGYMIYMIYMIKQVIVGSKLILTLQLDLLTIEQTRFFQSCVA